MSHCTYQEFVLQKYNSFIDVNVDSFIDVKRAHRPSVSDSHHILKSTLALSG